MSRLFDFGENDSQGQFKKNTALMLLLLGLLVPLSIKAEPLPSKTDLYIGSIMPLTVESGFKDIAYYSENMKRGLEAALANPADPSIHIRFEVADDAHNFMTTIEKANEMIDNGLFLMLGNVGGLSNLKLAPVLATKQVPSMGFFNIGEVSDANLFNYRPSLAQEVALLVETAMANQHLAPNEICVFSQNDVLGVAGVKGLKIAFQNHPAAQPIVGKLDSMLEIMMGGLNRAPNGGYGPIGFYLPQTTFLRDAYLSLKSWEKDQGSSCRFVALVALPSAAADFMAYTRGKKETWMFGAVSTTVSGTMLSDSLDRYRISETILNTRVVPELDAQLPLVADAREALKDHLNDISLEGYIVGRLLTATLKTIKGPLTRDHFVAALREKWLDVGGLKVRLGPDRPPRQMMAIAERIKVKAKNTVIAQSKLN